MKIRIQREEDETPKSAVVQPNKPTREYLESIWGNITRYNIKVMADGRQWVIHCLTGEPIERKDAQPVQDAKGGVMWIGKGETLSVVDQPTSHRWKNPDRATI